jgi:hypothetical protein
MSSSLDQDYRAAVAALEDAQRRLGATPRSDPEARAAATKEVEAATARVREAKEARKLESEAAQVAARAAKEAAKREGQRRQFAGIGSSPFYEACVARLDAALLAELQSDALHRQSEREQRVAERRQAKAEAPPASLTPKPTPRPPPPKQNGHRAVPEVYQRRPPVNGE